MQIGYLVEARFSIEENDLIRGSYVEYWFGVKQRNKELHGSALRRLQIPLDPNIKG